MASAGGSAAGNGNRAANFLKRPNNNGEKQAKEKSIEECLKDKLEHRYQWLKCYASKTEYYWDITVVASTIEDDVSTGFKITYNTGTGVSNIIARSRKFTRTSDLLQPWPNGVSFADASDINTAIECIQDNTEEVVQPKKQRGGKRRKTRRAKARRTRK
jgi:hypothetical protein